MLIFQPLSSAFLRPARGYRREVTVVEESSRVSQWTLTLSDVTNPARPFRWAAPASSTTASHPYRRPTQVAQKPPPTTGPPPPPTWLLGPVGGLCQSWRNPWLHFRGNGNPAAFPTPDA